MNPLLTVLIRALGTGVATYFSRMAMMTSSGSLILFVWLFIAALWTGALAGFLGQLDISIMTLACVVIGCFNGLANWCEWHANALSMSRNALFVGFKDILAISMTLLLVTGVVESLDATVALGGLLCIVAGLLIAYNDYSKKRRGGTAPVPMKFYLWVAAYSVLWGVAIFAIGLFALNDVGVWRFASGWYAGSTITGLVIFMVNRRFTKTDLDKKKAKILTVLIYAALIAIANSGALALQYLAFAQVSVAVLQPAFLIMDILVPSILGILIFKEGSQFDSRDKRLLVLGVVGLILIFGLW